MPRSNRPIRSANQSPGRKPGVHAARLVGTLLILAALLPAAARAHSVSICRGELVIHTDRLQVTLVVPAVDLVQNRRQPATNPPPLAWDILDDGALRFADDVVREFTIRDETGQPLPVEFVSVTHDFTDRQARDLAAIAEARVSYLLNFPIAAPPRFLSLQQTFYAHSGGHPAQLVLTLRSASAGTPRTIQLSSQGPPETIHVEANADAPGVQITQPADLRELLAEVAIQSNGVRMTISLPFRLLETWTLIPRADIDFLNSAEQEVARAAARDLLLRHNPLKINGAEVPPRIDSLRLLDPAQTPTDRLYTGSARLLAELSYPQPDPQSMDLTWSLFNNAVLLARVTVQAANQTATQDLNPYAPEAHWQKLTQNPVRAPIGNEVKKVPPGTARS